MHNPRGSFEPLESRWLLASDMLVSLYDDTAGQSVLRYDYTNLAIVPGGVATGNNGLSTAQGLAVAPDNSYYVSSFDTAQVLHYSANGTFLNVLGAGDGVQAPIFAPASLHFGPNGNLYLSDLGAQAIYQFDTTSITQQWIAANTLSLGYTPGGFTFSEDGNDELIVGSLDTQSVTQYHINNTTTTLLGPFSGVNPSSIIAKVNGDLLIGDFDLGFQPFDHHRIVLYEASTQTFDTFINLLTPVGTGGSAGYAPQPTSMVVDPDGNLLVGVSPDHNLNGQIQKYNYDTGAPLGILATGIGTPTAIAFAESNFTSMVAGRHLFYNQSGTAAPLRYDGNNPAINANDDLAIATNKIAYLPGSGPATFANVSSYTKGINGIMVDISGSHPTITADDFIFRVGCNNTPSTWMTAPPPATVSVRAGAGVGGSDRVTIVWANNAIQKEWLEVMVKSNADTSLPQLAGYPAGVGDVFFFGNSLGDSGLGNTATKAIVNTTDELAARNNPASLISNIPLTNMFDYNRDGQVNTTDALASRNNPTSIANALCFINLANPPAAPEASPASDNGAVASALSAPAASVETTSPGAPRQFVDRLEGLDLNGGLIGKFFEHLTNRTAPQAKKILAAVDQLADQFGLDDSLLDSLLADLGL